MVNRFVGLPSISRIIRTGWRLKNQGIELKDYKTPEIIKDECSYGLRIYNNPYDANQGSREIFFRDSKLGCEMPIPSAAPANSSEFWGEQGIWRILVNLDFCDFPNGTTIPSGFAYFGKYIQLKEYNYIRNNYVLGKLGLRREFLLNSRYNDETDKPLYRDLDIIGVDDSEYSQLSIFRFGNNFTYLNTPNVIQLARFDYNGNFQKIIENYNPENLEVKYQGLQINGFALYKVLDIYGFQYDGISRSYHEDIAITNHAYRFLVPPDEPRQPYPPPSPKPPKKKECCMCCDNNNDQLLKLILKRIGDYPGTLPASVKNSIAGTTTINSVAEHLIHNYKTLDEVVGSFPVKITIEDTDLMQDGQQSKTVEIENIAQGISEIFGSNILGKADTAAILAVCLSTLTEASQTKQIATKNYDILRAILDWLGFKFKEVSRKIVLMVKPGETKISDMVQPSEVDYITVEEDFGKSNFQLFINNISDFAAHWFAANRISLGKTNVNDNLQSLKSQFIDTKAIDKAIKTDLKDHLKPGTSDSDFDNFLEQAEKGFETLPDITPAQDGSLSPWGKPFSKRPKLTQKGRTNEGSSNL